MRMVVVENEMVEQECDDDDDAINDFSMAMDSMH
jgi:hypothetical protein